MANSPRLNVLIALTQVLETVTVANGFSFDLADLVFRGRNFFGENDPETMLSILEAPRPDVGLTAGENKGFRLEGWNLLLQGWCPDDQENPTDPAHEMMFDVEQCLNRIKAVDKKGDPVYPEHHMLGGLITSIDFGPGVVRPPTEGVSSKAFFYLPVRIGLVTRNG